MRWDTQDVFLIFWPTSPRSTETHKWWNRSVTGVGFAARSLPRLVPLPQKLYIQRIHDFQCAPRSSRDDYMYISYGIHAMAYRISPLGVHVAMLTSFVKMYLGLMSAFCYTILLSHAVNRRCGPSQSLTSFLSTSLRARTRIITGYDACSNHLPRNPRRVESEIISAPRRNDELG